MSCVLSAHVETIWASSAWRSPAACHIIHTQYIYIYKYILIYIDIIKLHQEQVIVNKHKHGRRSTIYWKKTDAGKYTESTNTFCASRSKQIHDKYNIWTILFGFGVLLCLYALCESSLSNATVMYPTVMYFHKQYSTVPYLWQFSGHVNVSHHSTALVCSMEVIIICLNASKHEDFIIHEMIFAVGTRARCCNQYVKHCTLFPSIFPPPLPTHLPELPSQTNVNLPTYTLYYSSRVP